MTSNTSIMATTLGTLITLYFIIGLVIGSLFLYIGARIAKIDERTFWKAIKATFYILVIQALCSFIFSHFLPFIASTIISVIVSFLIALYMTKAVYATTTLKAFIANIWIYIFIALLLAWMGLELYTLYATM